MIIYRLTVLFYSSIIIDIQQCFSHLKFDACYYVLKLSQDGYPQQTTPAQCKSTVSNRNEFRNKHICVLLSLHLYSIRTSTRKNPGLHPLAPIRGFAPSPTGVNAPRPPELPPPPPIGHLHLQSKNLATGLL